MLPDLHIGFSRGRWGGLVFPSLSEFSTVYCDPQSQRFGIVNKAEIDIFLGLSCFFNDPADVGNLISGSSAWLFRKRQFNEWTGRYSWLDFKYNLKNKHLKAKGRKVCQTLNILLPYNPTKRNRLHFDLLNTLHTISSVILSWFIDEFLFLWIEIELSLTFKSLEIVMWWVADYREQVSKNT